MRKALICGVSGQDGAYLAQLLLEKGYEVWGTSRDVQASTLCSLQPVFIDQSTGRTLQWDEFFFRQ